MAASAIRSGFAIAVLVLIVTVGRADVFNMPAGQTSLQFVTVGDRGNAPDATVATDGTTGYGTVDYLYQVGKFDVTAAQYAAFLNAVAKADPYGLYYPGMAAAPGWAGCGIAQSGTSGSFSYTVAAGRQNFPVNFVSWGDAARFVNWLQNGQPTGTLTGTGSQDAGLTEDGAYSLNGDTSSATYLSVARNSGARYWIPTENEWYKAAYYKGGGLNAGYWTYATRSNTAPSNVLSATGTNNANYRFNTGSSWIYTDPSNYLTPVGAFAASPGPYGTFDQAGDVWQWSETLYVNGGTYRGLRGADFDNSHVAAMSASYRSINADPGLESSGIGFRIASAPLPGDTNLDGTIDIADLNRLLTNYDKTGMTWGQGDFDGNGTADITDLNKVLTNYNKTTGASGAIRTVPEPGGTVLFGVGVLIMLVYWCPRVGLRGCDAK